MIMNREPEDRLTRLLRRGDPATEGGELSPAEAARMRHALVAVLEARKRPLLLRWRPVLATAAAAAFSLALVLNRWKTEDEPAPVAAAQGPTSPAAAVVPRAASEPLSAAPRRTVRSPAARGVKPSSRPTLRPHTRPERAATKPADTPAVHAARQIEFETPGGTRVVWVLDPAYQALSTEVEGR